MEIFYKTSYETKVLNLKNQLYSLRMLKSDPITNQPIVQKNTRDQVIVVGANQ